MRKLIADIKGTSSVEFSLVVFLFFLIIFGISDVARMMWQFNAASKATHWGARFAVVNDPPASGMATIDCLAAAGGNGVPCPTTFLDPGPVVCIQSGCTGSTATIRGAFDSAAFTAIVNRMNAIHDAITPANVRIEYRHVGLGFSGNPFGSDITPLVTVSLIGMNFNFLTPGLHGLVTLAMPDFRTTMTAEDQSTN
jgi:Flp pilus assembly protein TadG